jgi:hypothetical protein
MRRRALDPIAVVTGECYLLKRSGKSPVRIRITRVMRGASKWGDQPVAHYIRVTPENRPARRTSSWEPGPRRGLDKRNYYQAYRTVLTWRDGAWRLAHDAERIPCE